MKQSPQTKPSDQSKKPETRTRYERPAILYEGQISTRAGSPLIIDGRSTDVVDPAELFTDN